MACFIMGWRRWQWVELSGKRAPDAAHRITQGCEAFVRVCNPERFAEIPERALAQGEAFEIGERVFDIMAADIFIHRALDGGGNDGPRIMLTKQVRRLVRP